MGSLAGDTRLDFQLYQANFISNVEKHPPAFKGEEISRHAMESWPVEKWEEIAKMWMTYLHYWLPSVDDQEATALPNENDEGESTPTDSNRWWTVYSYRGWANMGHVP